MATTTPVTVTTTSAKWTLSVADWLKALAAAVLTPVIPILAETFSNGSLTFNWKVIAAAAGLGFVTFLGNALTNASKTIITGATPGSTVNVTVLSCRNLNQHCSN